MGDIGWGRRRGDTGRGMQWCIAKMEMSRPIGLHAIETNADGVEGDGPGIRRGVGQSLRAHFPQ